LVFDLGGGTFDVSVLTIDNSHLKVKIQQLLKAHFNRKEPNRGVNPDKALAYGAAVQAGVIAGDQGMEQILLLDITPLSQGIETVGGVMTGLFLVTPTFRQKITNFFDRTKLCKSKSRSK